AGCPLVDGPEKVARTNMAVFPPEIPRLHRLQKRSTPCAFLRMTIVTGHDIRHQAWGGLRDDQGLATSSPPLGLPPLLEAMRTRFEAVASDHFDPRALKPRSPRTAPVRDNRGNLTSTLTHQLCRRLRL